MSSERDQAATPSLDEWVAEAGEEHVAAAVRAAIRDIEEGAIPGFTDKQALLEYIGRHAKG